MSAPNLPGPSSTADSLFAAWLARREAGEDASLDELARAHPERAERLRDLHRRWQQSEIRRPGADSGEGSVTGVIARLTARNATSERYRLQGEIGRGGMGAVMRVWDEDLQRPLAMKLMLGGSPVPLSGDTPPEETRRVARFLEEAQVTGQLDHPGIVPVHEIGLDSSGQVFFTMKLVRGKTLRQVFEELARDEGGWTQTRVVGLLLRVCEAISYAHARGVIHRDLKPANVMVGSFGEVYVMDWGLARVLEEEPAADRGGDGDPVVGSEVLTLRGRKVGGDTASSLKTVEGAIMGTPEYMSPEQARGRLDQVGPTTDVYSMGAMLYHLLAGRAPVSALETPNLVGAYGLAVDRPLHECAPGTPAELAAICEKAMAWEPARRYPDMPALAHDLAAYLEGRVVRAYETGAWAEARKWVRRNKSLAASIAAAVLLLVLGLAIALVLRGQAQRNFELAEEKAREAQENLALAQLNEAEAKEQQERAEEQRRRAQENERLARAETAKVLRLSDVKVLQELEREVGGLWPAHPEQIPALESWLRRARVLAERLPGHRTTLAEMRTRGRSSSDEERERGREPNLRADELGPEVLARTDQVESLRTWTFETAEDQWQHDVLVELIGNLEALEAGLLDEQVLTVAHGWSVARRLVFAQELETAFAEGGEHAEAWAKAVPAIREAYRGLELVPQMGLVPIGPDPVSGLWEFWHVVSGERPARGEDGVLALTEASGLVLVLIPGGSFRMGAQPSDPAGWNYDPESADDEGPVHEVTVSPYFLSKYELTQGQWSGFTGRNPSYYKPPSELAPSLLHPVEQVSWEECMLQLGRMGLSLPSEAQWEYAARGGTDTPWWTGEKRESLAESSAANLADQAAAQAGAPWPSIKDWPELNDDYAVHAPVGSFVANPLGLHDVHGNVWELCLDAYDTGFYGRAPETDPVAPWESADYRVLRGGCYSNSADFARSAFRDGSPPSHAGSDLGVRPARIISQ